MKAIQVSLLTLSLLALGGWSGCASHEEKDATGRRATRVYNPETERFQRRPPYGERSNVDAETR